MARDLLQKTWETAQKPTTSNKQPNNLKMLNHNNFFANSMTQFPEKTTQIGNSHNYNHKPTSLLYSLKPRTHQFILQKPYPKTNDRLFIKPTPSHWIGTPPKYDERIPKTYRSRILLNPKSVNCSKKPYKLVFLTSHHQHTALSSIVMVHPRISTCIQIPYLLRCTSTW